MYITGLTKTVLLMAFAGFGLFTMSFLPKIQQSNPPMESIYDISLISIDGSEIDMNALKGKKVLFVNVASKCGFTPQYERLQKLHEMHGEELTIIGLPCNQFLGQEPGSNDEIISFCQKNYGVTFQLTEKIDVKGKNQHPLYSWLTMKKRNGTQDSSVKWNFQKYLVDEKGQLQAIFQPKTDPMDEAILEAIKN